MRIGGHPVDFDSMRLVWVCTRVDRTDTCSADGNKNDRMLVRYNSVLYSHRPGYAQLGQGIACGPGERSGSPELRRLPRSHL